MSQFEMDLGDYPNVQPFVDARELEKAREQKRLELWARACEVIEHVFHEYDALFQERNPSIIGQLIAEEMQPILAEYRKIMNP